MTNTPEHRHAFETMAQLANALNTGYQIESHISKDEDNVSLTIYIPGDTDQIAYPTVYFLDAFVDESGISFEIIPRIYSAHDLKQSQRVVNGLNIAMKLVEMLYATAKAFGIQTV